MFFHLSHYGFTLSEPFASGHVLTRAQAQALNALRGENIREIVRREWDRLAKPTGEDGLLSEAQVEAFQAKITEIDRRYEFKERPTSRPKAGTLGAEIESVAREAVEEIARRSGEAISISRFDDLVSDFQTRIDIQAEARRRLSAKIAQSKMAIEDLLG